MMNMKCRKRANKIPECGDCLEGYRRDRSRCLVAKCSDTRGTFPYVVFSSHCETLDQVCDDSSGTPKCVCANETVPDGIGGCKSVHEDCCSDVISNATLSGTCVGAQNGQWCSLSCEHDFYLRVSSKIQCLNGLWTGGGRKPNCYEKPSGCAMEVTPGVTAKQLCRNLNTTCGDHYYYKKYFKCYCGHDEYYDAQNRQCRKIALDVCPFVTLGENEECISGKKVCKPGYSRLIESATCDSDAQCGKGLCGDAHCEENKQDPLNPNCTCPDGYYFSRSRKTCESIACSFLSLHDCSQICRTRKNASPSQKTYECRCKAGFKMVENNCVVEKRESECAEDCGVGTCILRDGIPTCDCNLGFTFGEDSKCSKVKRLCQPDSIPEMQKMCPKYELKGKRFVCDCIREDQNEDGTCTGRTKCNKAEQEDCKSHNAAFCSREVLGPHTCSCAEGFQSVGEPFVCVEGCSDNESFECSYGGGVCKINSEHRSYCDCVSLIMDWDGTTKKCRFVKEDYAIRLKIKNVRKQNLQLPVGPTFPDYTILMKNFFGEYLSTARLINLNKNVTGNYQDWEFLIFFEEPPSGLQAVADNFPCQPVVGLDPTDCVLGGSLVVKKPPYLDVRRLAHNCSEKLCNSEQTNTVCEEDLNSEIKHVCNCKEGYKSVYGSHKQTSDLFRPNHCVQIKKCMDMDSTAVVVGSCLGVVLLLVIIASGVIIFKLRRNNYKNVG